MAISPIQGQLPFAKQSFQQDISPKLKKVRFDLMESVGTIRFTRSIPLQDSIKIRKIVNDYIGPDENQETDVARTFSSLQSDSRTRELFNNTILFEAQQINMNCFLGVQEINALSECQKLFVYTIVNLIKLDPSIGDLSIMETYIDSGIYTKLLHDLDSFIFNNYTIEIVGKIALFSQFLRIIYIFHTQVISVENGFFLSKRDRSTFHLSQWIERVIVMQQYGKTIIKPIALKNGHSQGFTYAIKQKQSDKICGYLHGTLHNDTNGVNQISIDTQKRLSECAVLGTELNHSLVDPSPGVENSLVKTALERGIAMIGIDGRRPEKTHEELYNVPTAAHKYLLWLYQFMIIHFYYTGNQDETIKLVKKTTETVATFHNKEYVLIERNHIMAENITTVLQASNKIAQEKQVAPIKCFFAPGYLHMNPSYEGNLVELLQKKGWTLEYIKPSPVPLRLRCSSLANCLFTFVITTVKTMFKCGKGIS